MSLSSLLMASGANEEARRENEALTSELEAAQREHKKLRQVVEQLSRDYEAAKDLDPLRRYQRLKGMAKRTVLHIRLDPDQTGSSQGIVGLAQGCKEYASHVEGQKRREERCSKMTRQDVCQDNARKTEQLREVKRKCSIIRDLIQQLEASYDHSKRYLMPQRYRLLKDMIKHVTQDDLAR
ncbi:uncharacterized protein LOC112577394 [Pomacea canaliculata]|uniref:uncharacterized protein LOC112577394 n=1 Tax=Pomacea canaliculata TaxID=400727 RepID=UPI000D728F9F|nr:uncharacterized protein LOC112577394 [Pomacea canaliculata]